MKKIMISGLFCCYALLCAAQNKPSTKQFEPGTFMFSGHIDNSDQKFFEVIVSDFFTRRTVPVMIDALGNFKQQIDIDGVQDFIIVVDKGSRPTLFAFPGDSIQLNWDAQQPRQSLAATANNEIRTRELKMRLKWFLARDQFYDLASLVRDPAVSQRQKERAVQTSFTTDVIDALAELKHVNAPSSKILTDRYFEYLSLFGPFNAPPQGISVDSVRLRPDGSLLHGKNFKLIQESRFRQSEDYREYLYSRISQRMEFTSGIPLDWKITTNFPEMQYYNSIAGGGNITFVKDWLCAMVIYRSFNFYDFNQTEEIYKDFLTRCKTPAFLAFIKGYYDSVKHLRKGSDAPLFTLNDIDGKPVSLASLKGKVVYIDFWGVYCAPCIEDIQQHVPKLHERYKGKNVVFVNICVDVKTAEWQEAVRELNLDGINLIAEGWNKNPVPVAYNINGIPHYVLIDPEGKLADANAEDPDQLLGKPSNDIDKLLVRFKL